MSATSESQSPTPFAIILSTFRTDITACPPKAQFSSFVQPGGKGMADFLKTLSNGRVDFAGSDAFGWFQLSLSSPTVLSALTKGTPPADIWMAEGIRLLKESGVDLTPFFGVIVIVDDPKRNDIMTISSRLPALGTGQALSGEQINTMSAAVLNTFDTTTNVPAAEGLNAPTLHNLGWLRDYRILTIRTSATSSASTVQLIALNQVDTLGCLMVKIITSNHVYTAELRPPSFWSTGIAAKPMVLIHELIPTVQTQDNWRNCNKCQCLTYTGNAICAAGGIHDHSTSVNFSLATNITTKGRDWRRCKKCQELSFYGGGTIGLCPAGGIHDGTGSDNFTFTAETSQTDWCMCSKCQGMAFMVPPLEYALGEVFIQLLELEISPLFPRVRMVHGDGVPNVNYSHLTVIHIVLPVVHTLMSEVTTTLCHSRVMRNTILSLWCER